MDQSLHLFHYGYNFLFLWIITKKISGKKCLIFFHPKIRDVLFSFCIFSHPKNTMGGHFFFEGVDFQRPPPRSHELDPRHGFGALRFDDFYAVFLLDTSIIGGFKPNGFA